MKIYKQIFRNQKYIEGKDLHDGEVFHLQTLSIKKVFCRVLQQNYHYNGQIKYLPYDYSFICLNLRPETKVEPVNVIFQITPGDGFFDTPRLHQMKV